MSGAAAIAAFARALEREDLLAELAAAWPPAPAAVEGLRRALGAEGAHAALAVAEARRKLARKWPGADRPLGTPDAAEQASSTRAAAHKAQRFAALAGAPRVLDLCAGIGGDARALGAVARTLAFDRDPLRAWMCARNAGGGRVAAAAADVEALRLRGEVIHMDPARREGPRRLHRYEDLAPGPRFIERALAEARAACVKLGPGVEVGSLPSLERREVEWIGEPAGLTQALLWSGDLARHPGLRTATRLPEGATITGVPDLPIAAAPLGRFLAEVDPAAMRAGLAGWIARERALYALGGDGLDLLGAAAAGDLDHPFLAGFEVLERLPLRERALHAALRAHGAGAVEVKTRARVASADDLQRALAARLRGEHALVVFALRLGGERAALLARRIARSGTLSGHPTHAPSEIQP